MKKEQCILSKYSTGRTDYCGNAISKRKKSADIVSDVSEKLKAGWLLIMDTEDYILFEREIRGEK